jgi:hypothetical protein
MRSNEPLGDGHEAFAIHLGSFRDDHAPKNLPRRKAIRGALIMMGAGLVAPRIEGLQHGNNAKPP